MKKPLFYTVLSFLLTMLFVGPNVSAATSFDFVGTTGDTSVDTDATSGGYYLRHVGNPAPVGYSHVYQWAEPEVVCDPNNTEVTFSGSVDVSSMKVGDVAMVGLVDQTLLATPASGWFSGAYVYVHKSGSDTMRIGPSDGFYGGEIVQVFGLYQIPGDNKLDIDMTIFDGEISVEVEGDTPKVDDYGQIEASNSYDAYPGAEFDGMAVLGWDTYPSGTAMPFDFTVEGCEPSVAIDEIAPIVSIDMPTDGDSVSGFVDISGSISDDVELSHYNLSLYPSTTDLSDGQTHTSERLNDPSWCTSPISGTINLTNDFSGYLCEDWDTTVYEDGEYQIRLAARDVAGNRDTSSPYVGGDSSVHVIKIYIDNTPDNPNSCKKSGWMNFFSPTFKNQGDCLSWLNSSEKAVGNRKDNQ